MTGTDTQRSRSGPRRARWAASSLDLRFRRVVFLQVVLGMTAFCVADGNGWLLGFMLLAAAAAWRWVEGGRSRPLPRGLINVSALGACGLLVLGLQASNGSPVSMLGRFALALQLLMLCMRKSPREYGMLLSLSLLQMIAASVLSTSISYGVCLMLYCATGAATLLLFQLKSALDAVVAIGGSAAAPEPMPRRPFYQTVAGLFAAATLVALVLFLLFPRAPELRQLGSGLAQQASPVAQVGFSQNVDLRRGSPATGSGVTVLHASFSLHGEALGEASLPLLLRGGVLDVYDVEKRVWVRGRSHHLDALALPLRRGAVRLRRGALGRSGGLQVGVVLRQPQGPTLFTPVLGEGPVALPSLLSSDDLTSMEVSLMDQRLSAASPSPGTRYRVHAVLPDPRAAGGRRQQATRGSPTNRLLAAAGGWWNALEDRVWASDPDPHPHQGPGSGAEGYARGWPVEPERVRALAHQILEQAGVPPPQAGDTDRDAGLDRRRLNALVAYLRREGRYGYAPPPLANQDPVLRFLFEDTTGHCELYAAGLAALARSIDIPARVVTGFRVSEFNRFGGYHVVRQNHAHAWIEAAPGAGAASDHPVAVTVTVDTQDQTPASFVWETYDATPPAAVAAAHSRRRGLGATLGLRPLLDHAEFLWVRTFVAFDDRTRRVLLSEVASWWRWTRQISGNALGIVARRYREALREGSLSSLLGTRTRPGTGGYVLIALLCLTSIATVPLVRAHLRRRWRLRTLDRLGLSGLGTASVGETPWFLLETLSLVERAGFRRDPADTLTGLSRRLDREAPPMADPARRLLTLSQQLRFGGVAWTPQLEADAKVQLSLLKVGVSMHRKTRQPGG